MKGLIIKDLMCLKKQLMMFCYVIVGVLIVSVMYVLSAMYGNLALAGNDMLQANEMTSIDVKNLGTMALVLFMLLPIATVGDMANVFLEDGKAGFYNIAGILPISLRKRLMSRYITIYVLFGIGIVIDLVIAFLLSVLTDMITFTDFLGIIISTASVMSIYSALVIFFCLLLGYGKEQYAQIFSISMMFLGFILFNIKKVKNGLMVIADVNSQISGETNTFFIWDILDFIKEKSWVLFLIAAFVSILSYVVSLIIVERKRGVF